MRDRARGRLGHVLYGFFAMGFRGSGTQWRHLKATYGVLAAIMAPLVVSVHSVVGLDFAGAATPGWHSTEYPPFFVFGALWSGLATVMLLLLAFRRPLGLTTLMTERHIQVLAKLLLTSSLCMSYAYMFDAFEPFYQRQGRGPDRSSCTGFAGDYAGVYWGMIFCNCLFPLRAVLPPDPGEPPDAGSGVASGSIVGMWLERFNIVVMSLQRTHLPSAWGSYAPTFWDWAIFAGTRRAVPDGLSDCIAAGADRLDVRDAGIAAPEGPAMIVAMLPRPGRAFGGAVSACEAERVGPIETYTPAPLAGRGHDRSPIPLDHAGGGAAAA